MAETQPTITHKTTNRVDLCSFVLECSTDNFKLSLRQNLTPSDPTKVIRLTQLYESNDCNFDKNIE